MYAGTLRVGYVDRLELDTITTAVDGCQRQGEEIRVHATTTRRWRDLHIPGIQECDAGLRGRAITDTSQKTPWIALVLACKDSKAPLRRGCVVPILNRHMREVFRERTEDGHLSADTMWSWRVLCSCNPRELEAIEDIVGDGCDIPTLSAIVVEIRGE